MQGVKAKLIKAQSLQTKEEQHYITVKEGDIIDGFFLNWPLVGTSFRIYKNIDNIASPIPIITTEVKEIIDDRTFRTKNSIYKIVTLEDERDNKISIIIE